MVSIMIDLIFSKALLSVSTVEGLSEKSEWLEQQCGRLLASQRLFFIESMQVKSLNSGSTAIVTALAMFTRGAYPGGFDFLSHSHRVRHILLKLSVRPPDKQTQWPTPTAC